MSDQPPPKQPVPTETLVDPFRNVTYDTTRGGDAYARFIELFRTVQDRVTDSDPPESTWDDASQHVEAVIALLQPWKAPEWQRPAGMRTDLPGRGNPLLLPFVIEGESDEYIRGRVTFRPFHLGGNNAAHGGTLPLLFDDVLGRIANAAGRSIARTAYLKVNYRHVTPIDVSLQVEGSIDRIEGRKRWATGRLLHEGRLVADAEALFVGLLPGQS